MKYQNLAAAAALSLLMACSGQKQAGQTLTTLTFGDWSSFDPAYCYDTSCGEVLQNTLETLFFYDGSSPSKLVPLLAAELPTVQNGGISPDGKTYRIKLSNGAKFSDGSSVTAQDVQYSLERTLVYSAEGGPAALLLEPLLGKADLLRGAAALSKVERTIETEGTDTVIFNLAKPFAPFLEILAGSWSSVYSKADALKKGDWDGTSSGALKFNNPLPSGSVLKGGALGSAPFTLSRFDVGRTVVLARSEAYWRGKAALERIVIQSVNDENTRIQTLKTGDAQMVARGGVSNAQLETVRALPGITVSQSNSLGLYGLFMTEQINSQGTGYLGSGKLDGKGIPADFFSDVNVRKGFAYAFNYDAFISEVLQGNGVQTNTILVTGVPGSEATSSLKYRYDPAQATQFFKTAWKGALWEKGFVMPAFFNSGNTTRQRALEILSRGLLSINPKFKLEVREIAFSLLTAQSAGNQLPLFMSGWGADYADPHSFAQPFLASSGIYPLSSVYSNPSLDRLIEQAISSTDSVQRSSLYREIAQIGFDEVPTIPIYQPKDTYVQSSRVKGRVFNPMFSGDYFYPISLEK